MKVGFLAVLATGIFAVGSALAPIFGAREPSSLAVKRGAYLVNAGGCNGCHTPWKAGPDGPAPDATRRLSGHPQELAMPAPKLGPGPWAIAGSATMTAWSGPWGVSFASNLTPDPATGLGKWSEQEFVEAMRSGRHMGRGRPILPPMPVASLAGMTDQDLKAIFAYLRTVPPIQNRVPAPVAPATAQGEARPAGAASPRK